MSGLGRAPCGVEGGLERPCPLQPSEDGDLRLEGGKRSSKRLDSGYALLHGFGDSTITSYPGIGKEGKLEESLVLRDPLIEFS